MVYALLTRILMCLDLLIACILYSSICVLILVVIISGQGFEHEKDISNEIFYFVVFYIHV